MLNDLLTILAIGWGIFCFGLCLFASCTYRNSKRLERKVKGPGKVRMIGSFYVTGTGEMRHYERSERC